MASLEAMLLTSRGAVSVAAMVEALDDGRPSRSPRGTKGAQAAAGTAEEEATSGLEPDGAPEPSSGGEAVGEAELLPMPPLPESGLAVEIRAALEQLREAWDRPERGLRLERVAGGWRFVTPPQLDATLRIFHGVQARQRLSQAALEVLAIVAHRQPVTQPEINFIRGTSSSGVVRTLLDRKLLRIAGRKKVVGKPFLYRTTREFLLHFGLERVEDIPEPETLVEDTATLALDGGEGLDDLDASEPVDSRDRTFDHDPS
jgi:segregation and condensation protein B